MKSVFLRASFFGALAIVQLSFINPLFSSWPVAPPVLFSSIASWAIFRGFSPSRVWAVWAGALLDAVSFSRLGVSSVECLIIAALFGFANGRILFGVGAAKTIAFGATLWVLALGFLVAETMVALPTLRDSISFLSRFFVESPGKLFLSSVFSTAMFAGVFALTVSFERYVSLFERMSVGRR